MRDRHLNEMLHLPSRRVTIEILAAACVIAVICWYFGVDGWHAILLGCAITVTALAVLVGTAAPDALDLSWRPGKRAQREGSRSDVANLSRSLRSGWGYVGLTAERQLQQIARRRLALEGLDLGNADHRSAIEQRIGAASYRVLVRPHGRLPRLGGLLKCLDALDAVDSTHYPVSPSRSRRWGLATIPFSLGRARER